MVTSASLRQSSRPSTEAGLRRVRLGFDRDRKHVRDLVGVDGDQAHRALGLQRAEPLLDAGDRQAEALLLDADRDQVAVLRVLGRLARDRELLAELLLVDRHQPPAAARQRAEDADRAGLGLVDDLDDAAGVANVVVIWLSCTRSSARSPTPATSCGRALRGVAMRIFGTGPCSSSSHSVGVASSSPSLSRPVMSASVTSGSPPALCSFLRRDSTWPSSASSRSTRFSSTRRSFFRLKARAISRVPALPGCSLMKARICPCWETECFWVECEPMNCLNVVGAGRVQRAPASLNVGCARRVCQRGR